MGVGFRVSGSKLSAHRTHALQRLVQLRWFRQKLTAVCEYVSMCCGWLDADGVANFLGAGIVTDLTRKKRDDLGK